MKAPLASVLTLGCKVNQFESSALVQSLIRAGYHLVEEPVGVELVVLNTCTVTRKADLEALALIRRIRRLSPSARIVATGCLAQANPELLAGTGEVTLVLGQGGKVDLIHHLESLDTPGIRVTPITGPAPDFGTPPPERTRAFYKIQDGCSAGCTYCAVPLSRGPERSLNLEQVLAGLREYLSTGLSEVVFCGIHLGQWGRDLDQGLNLAELLHTIEAELSPEPELFRLRLSSIEPLECDDELLTAYEMYPWLAPHFHLPLQSGSDHILELMGRPYRRSFFKELVGKLNERWPLAGVGVDVMVGFPGETQADFQATVELLEELPLSYFHIFPYSPRPGTLAAARTDQVPEPLKKKRARQLASLNKIKRRDFALRNQGTQAIALVENTTHRLSGRLKVLTGNYLSALLPEESSNIQAGTLVPVLISSTQNQNPWGILEAFPVFS